MHGPGGTCSELAESCGEGRVQPGAVTASIPAAAAACGRPAWGGLRAAIRVLPLGDPVLRSPSSQYPVPAGEIWSLGAQARGRGPLTGPLAFLALPARQTLTADSVLRPQRSSRARCARRVGAPPAIRHTVPARQCPAESGPAGRRSHSEQAHCARLVEPSRCRPGDRPRPGKTSCPSDQAHCARLVATADPRQRFTAGRQTVGLPAIRHTVPARERPADP